MTEKKTDGLITDFQARVLRTIRDYHRLPKDVAGSASRRASVNRMRDQGWFVRFGGRLELDCSGNARLETYEAKP